MPNRLIRALRLLDFQTKKRSDFQTKKHTHIKKIVHTYTPIHTCHVFYKLARVPRPRHRTALTPRVSQTGHKHWHSVSVTKSQTSMQIAALDPVLQTSDFRLQWPLGPGSAWYRYAHWCRKTHVAVRAGESMIAPAPCL